ncbi:MAG: response regulator [Spirochaetaceae bacterium]|nr:response regulator [Spirochaetaceae bacterium]
MKRVLIVDDEQPMVLGLSLLIKRHFSQDYSIVGTASSGREAVELDAVLNPDILLMDVQMPGISGLEAIRTIARKGNPKAFVLVTAYERFDIAREALSLGVCDYLLKPVSRDRLEIALRVASDYLDRLNMLAERELELRDTMRRLAPSLSRALFDCMEHGGSEDETGMLVDTLGIRASHGIAGVAIFPSGDVKVSELYRRFRDILEYKTEAMAGPLRDGRWCTLFIPLQSASDSRSSAIRSLVQQTLPSPAGWEIGMWFGSPVPIGMLARSFREAFQHFAASVSGRMPESPAAIEYADAAKHDSGHTSAAPFLAMLSGILEDIGAGRFHAASRSFSSWVESWKVQNLEGSRMLQAAATVLTALAGKLHAAGAISLARSESAIDMSELRAILESGAKSAFIQRCMEKFNSLLQSAEDSRPYSQVVRKALQYIENHFAEQISLESAAESIGISPGRLSRLMAEETGRGFARTLIEYRMQRAQELLRTPGWTVRRVSEACGYPDANYFARLFRKLTGFSPKEFAERREEENG